MAGEYYSVQEACERLGITEDELRNLVREGRLREFRDASGMMYRAGEIDSLAAEMGRPQEPAAPEPAAPAPAGEPAAEPEQPAPEQPAAEEPASEESSVFALEAGDSGAGKTDVFSLETSDEGGGEKTSSGSGSSISLLDDLESITIPADPLAETVVAAGELDSGGSGSGLLDLARESDDTSLGAELYDEFAEGEAQPEAAAAEAIQPEPVEYAMAPTAAAEPVDPMVPGFVGMAVVGLITLLIAGMAVSAAVVDAWPSVLAGLYSNLWLYLLGAVLAAGVFWLIGWMLGRQTAARQAAFAQAGPALEETQEEGS